MNEAEKDNQEKLQPQLRFKGFTNPWEQRKLSDFLKISTQRNSANQYGKYSVLSVSRLYGVVNQINLLGRSFAGSNLSGYKVVYPSDVIYTKSPLKQNPYGIIETTKLTGIVSPLYAVYQPLKNVDPYFIHTYFALDTRLNNYLIPLVTKGAKNTLNVSDSEALNGHVVFPPLKEQTALATFFRSLDMIIAAAKRKEKLLKQQRQAYLQLMFPRNREKQPRLRFLGFTGDWELRQLGDMGKFHSGVGFPNAEQGGTSGIPFFKVSDMSLPENTATMNRSQNYVTDEQIHRKKWKVIQDLPAIFFAKIGAALYLDRKRLVTAPFLLDNNTMEFSLYKDQLAVSFAIALFNNLHLANYAQAGALPSLQASGLGKIHVRVPNKKEQSDIGQFFQALDSLIAAAKNKVEALQRLKQGYMQQMFV